MATRNSSRPRIERQIVTQDGRLRFELKRVSAGIWVGRHHLAELKQVEYAAVFSERAEFHRYLDLDELRFRYVPQFAELKRAFDDLLAIDI